jgi:Tfp pilus assembly protein PilO
MTPKNKNKLVIASLILVILLAYEFAIKKTLEARNSYLQLQNSSIGSADIPQQLTLLKKKKIYLDSILEKHRIKATSYENNILNKLNEYADEHSLKIVEFKKPHVVVQDSHVVNTYEFTVEGPYNSLIKLVHTIEQKTRFGEVSHLKFEKKKNLKTGKYYLQVRVLVRGYT